MDLSGILKWLTDNPIVMSILSALAAPLLAKIPGVLQILNLVAGLVGYELRPKAPVTPVTITQAVGSDGKPLFGSDGQPIMVQAAAPLGGIIDWIKSNPLILVAIVGGVILFASQGGGCKPKPAPTPNPVPPSTDHPAPPSDLQSIVAPIKTLSASKPDAAAQLAGYWLAGADVIRRDGMILQSTGQLRLAKLRADQLYLQRSPLVGSFPGIGAATDAALSQAVGLDDAAITPASRERIAGTFDAIAWALGG